MRRARRRRVRAARSGSAVVHAHADQARDRDSRREPHVRSRLRHLQAAPSAKDPQPLVRRHHQRGRNAGPELRAGDPILRRRFRRAGLLHEPDAKEPLRLPTAAALRRADEAVLRDGQGGCRRRERAARELLAPAHRRRHRPAAARDRYPHRRRDDAAARALPAHARRRLSRLCGEPGASLLPDVAAARLQRRLCDAAQSVGLQERSLPVGRGLRRRRRQRRAAAFAAHRRDDRRRLDGDGLLQRLAGRRAVPHVPRRSLRHERQLPPGGAGRHRRQPRRHRHRRRRLVLGRPRPRRRAAREPDRESERAAGDQQLVHARRLLGRHLQRLRRRETAGRRSRAALFVVATASGAIALRARPLLSVEQLRARILRRRLGQPRRLCHSAVDAAYDRRAAPRPAHLVRVLRRSVEPLSRRSDLHEPAQHLLRHLQLLPVLDGDHDQSAGAHRAPQGHDSICTTTSRTAGCPRSRSSSRAPSSTAIRRRRSSICSRAS